MKLTTNGHTHWTHEDELYCNPSGMRASHIRRSFAGVLLGVKRQMRGQTDGIFPEFSEYPSLESMGPAVLAGKR